MTKLGNPIFLRKPKPKKLSLVRFWIDQELHLKFSAECNSNNIYQKDVFAQFMKWFVETKDKRIE